MDFSKDILKWYFDKQRDFPWRMTKNPYKIWLSEIILQQTRTSQGLNYYIKFTDTFPKIKDLAEAKEEEVLKLWQGLGYYSRARNLHKSAKYIHETLNGEFPKTYNELLKLKGVGPYTAAAISSICFKEKKQQSMEMFTEYSPEYLTLMSPSIRAKVLRSSKNLLTN